MLASKARVSQGQISKLEAGQKSNPAATALERIATALGVTLNDLLKPKRRGKMAAPTAPTIVRARRGYRLVGTNIDTGHPFLVDNYSTLARATRAQAYFDRIIQADAFAVDAVSEAIARVQREAHVPRHAAIESLADALTRAAR